jgi:hypothetical protein
LDGTLAEFTTNQKKYSPPQISANMRLTLKVAAENPNPPAQFWWFKMGYAIYITRSRCAK